MGRRPCCEKEGMNRGAWTAQEDNILTDYINAHREGQWRTLPKKAGLKRCGKSCRLRWLNYLRPDIVRGNITPDEEELIIRLHKLLGNRWSLIAGRLPGRTDNEIKNYWNTNLGKRVRLNCHQQQKNGECRNRRKAVKENIPSPDLLKAVRTKALKCSSRVIVCPSSYQQPPDKDDRFLVSGPNSISTPAADLGLVTDGKDKAEEGFGNAGVPLDLVMDFEIGDICLSELLGSDFWEATAADGFDMSADGSFLSGDRGSSMIM